MSIKPCTREQKVATEDRIKGADKSSNARNVFVRSQKLSYQTAASTRMGAGRASLPTPSTKYVVHKIHSTAAALEEEAVDSRPIPPTVVFTPAPSRENFFRVLDEVLKREFNFKGKFPKDLEVDRKTYYLVFRRIFNEMSSGLNQSGLTVGIELSSSTVEESMRSFMRQIVIPFIKNHSIAFKNLLNDVESDRTPIRVFASEGTVGAATIATIAHEKSRIEEIEKEFPHQDPIDPCPHLTVEDLAQLSKKSLQSGCCVVS